MMDSGRVVGVKNKHPFRRDITIKAGHRSFFLGNSSGIALVSSVFGVSAALANMVPLSPLGVMPCDLSIPKLYRRRQDGRLLGFDEISARRRRISDMPASIRRQVSIWSKTQRMKS
jgi:putative glycosyltransferase (TIGR04372 family)